MPKQMPSPADIIAELNDLMRALGYRTTYALGRSGWVSEHIRDTGNTFHFRTPELLEKVAARRRQLERGMTQEAARHAHTPH